MMTRIEAENLLHEWTQSESLRRHALSVETAMRAYARKFGEDEEFWGVVGLVHDLDYEKHPTPDEHPLVGVKVLEEKGFPEDGLEAIKGHAEYLNVPRTSNMAKALFAVDELVGLITACVLVRPTRNISDMKIKSVKKKWKQMSFAAGVDRDVVAKGMAMLDVEFDEITADVINALREVSDDIGL